MNQNKTVLVADDDSAILEVIKIILEENNFKVITISNGAHVESLVRQSRPGLVLLDIWMSGYDGRDVARSLKSDSTTRQIPILLISAHSDTERMAREAGADGFIAKPFDMNHLIAMVAKFI